MSEDLRTFYKLAREAERLDSEDPTKPMEPIFEAILADVLRHPALKSLYVEAFLEVLRDPDKGPEDLVAYCMHELRWPEFRSELLNWVANERSGRRQDSLKRVLLAFEDNWRDRAIYERFSR